MTTNKVEGHQRGPFTKKTLRKTLERPSLRTMAVEINVVYVQPRKNVATKNSFSFRSTFFLTGQQKQTRRDSCAQDTADSYPNVFRNNCNGRRMLVFRE